MKRPFVTIEFCSFLFSLSLAIIGLGCLAAETTEYKITMNEDGKSGTILTIMRNIQSDETDPGKQQKDFEQAIESWQGDEYLLDRVHDGIYVKDRSLSVEHNVLVWKEKGIFSELGDVFRHELKNDTLKFVVKGDQKIIATNGIVLLAKDSTIVYWVLPASKEMTATLKETNFSPKSDFVTMFKAYLNPPK